jgi:beta-barrel assembly-enhancing protease
MMTNSSRYAISFVFAAGVLLWPAVSRGQSDNPAPTRDQPANPCATPANQNSQDPQTQAQQEAARKAAGCPDTSNGNGQGNSGQNNSGQNNSGQNGQSNSGQNNSGQANSGQSNSNSGQTNSGQSTGDQPVQQQQTVHPKNAEQDVNAIGNRNPGKGLDFYSIEKEIALGKQLAQQVEKSSRMIDDPVVTEYVNRVGQNLVRNSDARVPFTIKVIDSDEVNAFALPGGFFYVNSGLILKANEESELAGVMAHEISHVICRHGTKQATKADLMQIGAMAAMIFVPYGWAGYGIYEGMNLAIPLTFLKFSRDAEREADFLGIQYMYKAGYDPNSYVAFFERIEADEKRRPGTIPKMFSTHPPTPDRIESAQKEIARLLPEKDEYIVTTSEFDSVKSRLRNVMFARKVQDNSPGKPTLRTKTEQQKQPSQTQTQGQSDPNSGDDDRPTLKRRPDDDSTSSPPASPSSSPSTSSP